MSKHVTDNCEVPIGDVVGPYSPIPRVVEKKEPVWAKAALAATGGTQMGAIIHAALGRKKEPPYLYGKAQITSDGYVLCNFVDTNGIFRNQAFVGSAEDYARNVIGLGQHLNLQGDVLKDYQDTMKAWIEKDWRQ